MQLNKDVETLVLSFGNGFNQVESSSMLVKMFV